MADIKDQPTPAPSRKVAYGGLGGALAVIVIALIEGISEVTIDAQVASAVTVVMTFLVSYFVRERS